MIQNILLRDNPIEFIGEDALKSLSTAKVKFLSIKNSSSHHFNITPSHPFYHPFRHLVDLESLLIEYNNVNLTNVDAVKKSTNTILPNLKIISLEGNPLKRIEKYLFYALRDSQVTEINLRHCQLHSISRKALLYLPHLKHIDLYGNPSLLMLGMGEFALSPVLAKTGIEELGLGANFLLTFPKLLLETMKNSLKSLNLSGNMLCHPGSSWIIFDHPMPKMEKLEKIKMMNALVRSIGPKTFINLPSLKRLELQGNMLTKIVKGILHVPNLEYLDLSYQCLDFQLCIKPEFDLSGLQNLTNLAFLGLDGLRKSVLDHEHFSALHKLEILKLKDTKIKVIKNFTFLGSRSLKRLDLSMNVALEDVEDLAFFGLNQLESLNISYTKKIFGTKSISLPSSFNFSNLKSLDITCTFSARCQAPHAYTVFKINLDFLSRLKNLEELRAGGNGFASWTDDIFESNTDLNILTLNDNQFNFLSDAMLSTFLRVKSLDIRNNPFVCSDNIAHFYMEVENRANLKVVGWKGGDGLECIIDPSVGNDSITFKDHAESWILDQRSLSNQNSKTSAYLTLALGGFLTSSLIGLFVFHAYRNRFFIGCYFTQKNRKSLDCPENSKEFKFDVFVSYSNTDAKWVMEALLPKLEDSKPFNLKCCIHERDFEVGMAVTENIAECIDRSRVFLIVLSKGYVESKWCLFEAHVAQSRPKAKTIIIVKEKVDSKNLNSTVRLMLSSWTYLEWPSQDHLLQSFWKRLSDSLSKKALN